MRRCRGAWCACLVGPYEHQYWGVGEALPLLEGENNLPLGIQVIGERYDDNRFLGVSSWLEKESEKFNE